MHQTHSFLRIFLVHSEQSAAPLRLAPLRSYLNITSSEKRQPPHWPLPHTQSPSTHCLILPSSQQLLILPINLFISVFDCCLPLCSEPTSVKGKDFLLLIAVIPVCSMVFHTPRMLGQYLLIRELTVTVASRCPDWGLCGRRC